MAQGGLQATLSRLDLADAFAEDMGVVIEATIGAHDDSDHLTRIDFQGGSVHVSRCAEAPGTRKRFRIQARDVSLATQKPEHTSILNVFQARVVELADATVSGSGSREAADRQHAAHRAHLRPVAEGTADRTRQRRVGSGEERGCVEMINRQRSAFGKNSCSPPIL